MTDIKIPASIDQQAALLLEECGCWDERNEAGSLVGFIVLTMREVGLEAELRKEDEYAVLGKNVAFVDIQVRIPGEHRYRWVVSVSKHMDGDPTYTIRPHLDSELGVVTRFSAVLAIVCSGLTYIDIRALQNCAAKAYADGDCHALDIADTFTYLGYLGFGVHVEDGEFYHIEVSKGGTVTYVVIPLSNKDYGVYYKATNLYLGSVNSIAAVVAIVCGGVTFYDDVSDKVVPLSEEDAQVFSLAPHRGEH